ncbi:unnamed protein product, partial [Meganyctiphanes norvegica]
LLGMMQQSMTPKTTTEAPLSQNSLLNNFLNSWFKPILEYTNKSSNVISSLSEESYEIFKNNTIQWPNIIATNITKDTVKINQPSEGNNEKQQNISSGNNISHSISVNNTVSNHVPAYPDIINLNINIFQNGKKESPSHDTISSDIYDYYEYYDYEFPRKPRKNDEDYDSIKTESNENIKSDSVDETTAGTYIFERLQENNDNNVETNGSKEILGISQTDKPLLIDELGPIDPDNPFQFPRTTTAPPPEAINPADLLVSRTQILPDKEHKKPTRTQLEDALILLLDLQDQFNKRNLIQPQLDAAPPGPPPPKPPPAIINLQGPQSSGTSFQVSLSQGPSQSQQFEGLIQQQNPYPRPRPSEPFSNSFQPQPASISSSDQYNPYPELTSQYGESNQGSNGGPPYPPYPPPPGYQGYPAPPPYPYQNYPPYPPPYRYPHYGGCTGGSASTSTSTG